MPFGWLFLISPEGFLIPLTQASNPARQGPHRRSFAANTAPHLTSRLLLQLSLIVHHCVRSKISLHYAGQRQRQDRADAEERVLKMYYLKSQTVMFFGKLDDSPNIRNS